MVKYIKPEQTSPFNERRKTRRIPVSMGVRLSVTGAEPDFFFSTDIVDVSEGGIAIKWQFCKECTGFSEGGIHPDCLFAGYDYARSDSRELVFHIEIANAEQDLTFKGRAVHVSRTGAYERVGIVFTSVSPEVKAFLAKVV